MTVTDLTSNSMGWHLSRNAQPTTVAMYNKASLRAGTKKQQVFWAIYDAERGLTDFELKAILNEDHEVATSTRNGLMNTGYIEDSGLRRNTGKGNPAIVWNVTYWAQCRVDQGLEKRI